MPWDIEAGMATARRVAGLFYELAKARAWCEQLGLVCLGKTSDDDPCFVEVWT